LLGYYMNMNENIVDFWSFVLREHLVTCQ